MPSNNVMIKLVPFSVNTFNINDSGRVFFKEEMNDVDHRLDYLSDIVIIGNYFIVEGISNSIAKSQVPFSNIHGREFDNLLDNAFVSAAFEEKSRKTLIE